jgi:hypothetical protein
MSTNNYYNPATGKDNYVMATASPIEPMGVPMGVPNFSAPMGPNFSAAPAPDISESQLKRLVDQGFTLSLARSLNETKRAFALRIWVIDNSGSMQKADGHRIVNNGKASVAMVNCSRWEEIRETVDYHIQMADMIDAPTRFRFLNDPGTMIGPQKFSVADSSQANNLHPHTALGLLHKVLPGGCTPLTDHIIEIYTEIYEMVPELRRTGQKVVIVLATVS